MKIITILGARPQFIKAAMVSRAIQAHNLSGKGVPIIEEIIHTGQHFDANMSEVFFRQMSIPEPCLNLDVHGGLHGDMTGRMLRLLEPAFLARKPDLVLVYGDTNSTLAGALTAAKLQLPIAHVEAGLRSYNRKMPEEINRVLTDHISQLLFCPTHAAVRNLEAEGLTAGTLHVGDVMYDAALIYGDLAARSATAMRQHGLAAKAYYLATIHRAENTDDDDKLRNIISGLQQVAREHTVIFPVHPRTRERLRKIGLLPKGIMMIDPVSYLDMVQLEKHALGIVTDSGGVQKEAYFHRVPCVTVRCETEWGETVASGWNTLTGDSPDLIYAACMEERVTQDIADYGSGDSAEKIVKHLLSRVS